RIAGIENVISLLHDPVIIDCRVIAGDYNEIALSQKFLGERHAFHNQIVLFELRDIGIVIDHLGPVALEQLNYSDGRRFAEVADVTLVGHAQSQNLRFRRGHSQLIEQANRLVAHKLRHAAVDFAGQSDEMRVEIKFLRLPLEIMRIERYAMSADSWSRI